MPTLLLADDSVTIQRVIEMTFAGEDITVLPVSDGEQAIARIEELRPDIVLADIAMPKRSGYDVAAFVKSRPELAHIPVLLLAGAFEPVDQARAEQVKCDGVLVKPFEPQQVIARVRELLGGARGTPSQATPGVPRPVERLTSLKLVEPRRERTGAPVPTPATPPPETAPGVPAQAAVTPVRPSPTVPPVESPAPSTPAAPAARPAWGDPEPETAPSAGIDDSLDDYFDRLDEAFANLSSSPATQANPAAPTSTPPSRTAAPGARAPEPQPADEGEVPTIDSLLGLRDTRPTAAPTPPAAPPPAAAPPAPTPMASPMLAPVPAPIAAPVIEPPDSSPTLAPQPAPPPAAPPSSAVERSRNAIADAFSALLAAELGEPGAAPVQLKTAKGEPQVTDAFVEEVTRRVVQRLAPDVVRDVVVDVVADIAERLIREEIARIRDKK